MNRNWKNRTMWTGDNLDIMRGMNSESVDLIYLDPPFNSKKNYSAPIGSQAAGAAFKDTWTLDDVDLAWHGEIAEQNPAVYAIIDAAGLAHGKGMKSYLIMMAVRIIEMQRLLKETGSVYLHCDPTASHYLKMLMDSIFGQGNFRNEIIWSYRRWPSKSRHFQTMHDVVVFYAMGKHNTFNVSYEPPSESYLKRFKGKTQILDPVTKTRKLIVDEPTKGLPMRDVWDISILAGSSKERLGYPTQKPLTLLERIIEASSNKGDIVLDPFAGCATACVAAERLDRQWAGIDISDKAVDLVQLRVRQIDLDLFRNFEPIRRSDIPRRTDLGKLPSYRTHKHQLFGKQEGRCGGCRETFPFRNFTIDHVVPQSKGGTDHFDNLQLLCGACNSTKGAGTQAELIAKLKEQGVR